MSTKIPDMDKEVFVQWHGEYAWKELCSALLNDKELMELLAKRNSTAEGFTNRLMQTVFKIEGHIVDGRQVLLSKLKRGKSKRVLMYNGEYGIQLFDAEDGETLDKAALKLLQERIDAGDFPNEDEYYTDAVASRRKPQFNQEEIEKMTKDSSVRREAEQEHHNYKLYLDSKLRYDSQRKLLKHALEKKDGKTALKVLLKEYQGRRDSVSIVTVDSVEDTKPC